MRRRHEPRALSNAVDVAPTARHVVPGFTARAAIVYDNRTGEVLWERNADEPLPPASTTKVVSAAVALRSGRLDESVEISPEAAGQPRSKIGLRAGWRMRLRDLVYAMLLNSANDASVAVAEGVSGSVEAFADRMNQQARRCGATGSHFVNPNGLPGENHLSTAHDLAMVFSHALEIPLFEEILSTSYLPVWPTYGRETPYILRTHNRMLDNPEFRVIGKTGWTQAAGKCFVGATRTDGREVIVAVLGSRNLWGDVRRLVEFGVRGGLPPDAQVASAAVPERLPEDMGSGDSDTDAGVAAQARRPQRSLGQTTPGARASVSTSMSRRAVAERNGKHAQGRAAASVRRGSRPTAVTQTLRSTRRSIAVRRGSVAVARGARQPRPTEPRRKAVGAAPIPGSRSKKPDPVAASAARSRSAKPAPAVAPARPSAGRKPASLPAHAVAAKSTPPRKTRSQ